MDRDDPLRVDGRKEYHLDMDVQSVVERENHSVNNFRESVSSQERLERVQQVEPDVVLGMGHFLNSEAHRE